MKDTFGKCPKCGKYNGDGYYLPDESMLCYDCANPPKPIREELVILARAAGRALDKWLASWLRGKK